MQLFQNINFDFLGKKKICFTISGVLILAGIISLIIHGGPEYNIDFTGGKFVEFKSDKPLEISEIRQALSDLGLEESEVQNVKGENLIYIRTLRELSGEEDLTTSILNALQEKYPDTKISLLRDETVGPKIGEELRGKALWAILIALLGILIYVTFRFKFRFAVAAIIALFHDVFITLGLFSLMGKEISLSIVAALLTIVGYSINDTIVISDRIRENTRILYRETFEKLVNTSLNQTFSRTIITSLVVLIVLFCIFFLGGPVIRDFSLALIIGSIVGTYSSIYVVSPIVVQWEKKFPRRVKK
ncbi:protein translocase subunit SecF [bacterium]|nr:protein translocase subunit SecF [bacterium]